MREKEQYFKKLLFAAVLFTLSYFIVLTEVTGAGVDYKVHLKYVPRFREIAFTEITYPLWHFLVYVVYKIGHYCMGNMPIVYACATVSAAVTVSLYLTIEKELQNYKCHRTELLAFGLSFITPVYIPWFNEKLYYGQGSPTTWHNPTNLMAKPFAVYAFFLTVSICEKIRKDHTVVRKDWLKLTICVFLSVLAKPSFFQGFVPALGVYILVYLILCKFSGFKNYLKLIAAFVPSALMILYDFFINFYTGQGEGIGIGWFVSRDSSLGSPWISLLLVILFPVLYMVFNFRKSVGKTTVQLSWLFVAVSWLEDALLYENGKWMYHGNFSWAAHIAYLVVWVVTTIELASDWQNMDMRDRKEKLKNTFLTGIWLFHLVCGFYYAYELLTVPGQWY